MLFSQPEVAAFLDEHFECAWESVAPVPRLTLEFGNGRRLERTLRGNVATWITMPDGRALDLVPGVVSAEAYVERLRESLELARIVAAMDDANATRFLAGWHWTRSLAPRYGPQVPVSKFRVEDPLEVALGSRAPTPVPEPAPEQLAFAVSKVALERPLIDVVSATEPLRDAGLALDTQYALTTGWPQAHAFLRERGRAPVADLTAEAYRRLLHVDLDDPYLGLAPDVLGGEVGRH